MSDLNPGLQKKVEKLTKRLLVGCAWLACLIFLALSLPIVIGLWRWALK